MLYRHHPERPVIKPLWNRKDTSVMSSQATHILNLQYSCSFRPKNISMTRLLLNVRADYHDKQNQNANILEKEQFKIYKFLSIKHVSTHRVLCVETSLIWIYLVDHFFLFCGILVFLSPYPGSQHCLSSPSGPSHQSRPGGGAPSSATSRNPHSPVSYSAQGFPRHAWSDYGGKKILNYIDKLSPLATLKQSVTLCTFLILTSHDCE